MARLEKKLLEERASFVGHISIELRHWYSGTVRRMPFTDIAHYFNSEMLEVGCVVFPNTQFERVQVFHPPRIWSKESLANLTVPQFWFPRAA
jgi:hypothetical protein